MRRSAAGKAPQHGPLTEAESHAVAEHAAAYVYTVEICRVAFSEKAELNKGKEQAKSQPQSLEWLSRWTGTLKFLLSPSVLGFSGRTMVHREHIPTYSLYFYIM